MESVCGGNSTAGSNPALSASFDPGPDDGVRGLCIAALRTVSGLEGSSTKVIPASAAGYLGSIIGFFANGTRRCREYSHAIPPRVPPTASVELGPGSITGYALRRQSACTVVAFPAQALKIARAA